MLETLTSFVKRVALNLAHKITIIAFLDVHYNARFAAENINYQDYAM